MDFWYLKIYENISKQKSIKPRCSVHENLWQRTTSSFAASCLCFGRHVVFHRGGVGRPDRHTAVYMNRWDPNPKGCFFLRGNTEIHQINALNVQYSANMSWNKYSDALRNLGSLRSFEIRVFLWMSQRQSTSCRRFDVLQCWPPLTWRWRLCKKWKERYWWYLYILTQYKYVYIYSNYIYT